MPPTLRFPTVIVGILKEVSLKKPISNIKLRREVTMSYAIENGNNKKRKNFITTKITYFY